MPKKKASLYKLENGGLINGNELVDLLGLKLLDETDQYDVFNQQVGQQFFFYGAHSHRFKLDNVVWEAVEDPDDGYRSYMSTVKAAGDTKGFYDEALAIVRLDYNEDIERYFLVDIADRHVWLAFGTDRSEDYYPCFVFQYTPKKVPPKPKVADTYVRDSFDDFFEPR